MNRQRRRKRARQRRFRVEAVPRQSPDLHKLAQVFLGMALARAEENHAPADSDAPDVPRPRERGEVE